MATRRIVSSEKTILEKDDRTNLSPPAGEKSNIGPAVPLHIIAKLLFFTLAMAAGPIGTYFLTLNTIFQGNSTFAGGAAAIMANLVLVSYIIIAVKEDQSEAIQAAEKGEKGL